MYVLVCKGIFWKQSHYRVNGKYLQVWEIIFSPFWVEILMLFEASYSKGIILIEVVKIFN